MYQQIGALPDWLTKLGASLIKGTTVSIPTPAGPVTVDLGNPASVAAAKAAVTGTKLSISTAPKPTTPVQAVNAAVTQNVPGGWLTIGLGAAAAMFLLPRLLRGSRG